MSNWLQNSVDSFNNEDSLDRFANLWGVQNSELVHRARDRIRGTGRFKPYNEKPVTSTSKSCLGIGQSAQSDDNSILKKKKSVSIENII